MGNLIADLIFVAIGLAIIIVCIWRGFIKIMIRSCSLLLAVLLTYFLGGHVANLLFQGFIGEMVRNSMYETVNNIYMETAGQLDPSQLLEQIPAFLHTEELQTKLLSLGTSGEAWVNTVAEQLATPLASFISNIVGYILVFLVSLVGLFLLSIILDKIVENIPLLDRTNKILGGVCGLIIALIVMFMISSIMKLFFADSAVYANSAVIRFFGDSALLKVLKIFDVGSLLLGNLVG